MVSIKDINKNIKKNLFDPIDKTKNKFSSLLKEFKKNKVKKDLALQKQLEKEKKRGDFSLPPSPHESKLSDSLNI